MDSTLQLVISLTPSGWQVVDCQRRLRASWYTTQEEAEREARDYLAMRGGGRLVVRQRKTVVSVTEIDGSRPEAA